MKHIISIIVFVMGLMLPISVNAQNKIFDTEITGTVYESATGKPLVGAKVLIPDVTSAITDENGTFKLKKSIKGAYVVVNAPGFATKQIALSKSKGIKIYLLDNSFKGKYENVLMPFDMTNAVRTTSAISSHENRDDYKLCAATIDGVLQGNLNGLKTVSRSGAPGSGANLSINGINSLNASSQPLIIVDGLPYENQPIYSLISGNSISALSDIDVKDIENITVLKDGASMYGSKGANGVILINTIRSKDMATRINFYAYTGVTTEPANKYKMLDASNYKSYLADMLSSKGLSSNEINALPYINSELPTVEKWGISGNKDYYKYNHTTDWQNEVFNSSINTNYHLNVTGGDAAALYAISVGYLNHGGSVDNTSFSRYTMRVNANIKMTDMFKLNASISLVNSDRVLAYEGSNKNFNPVYAGLVKAPFTATNVYNVTGERTPNLEGVDMFNISNPRAIINNSSSTNSNTRFFGVLDGVVTFSKYLNANLIFGLTSDATKESVFFPQAGINHTTLASAEVTNESQRLRNKFTQVNADVRLNYKRTFDFTHDIAVHLGSKYQTSNSELDWGKAYNTSSDEMKTLSDGESTMAQVGGSLGNWSSISNYLNVEYGNANKYFFTMNMALDGSSRFGKNADGISIANNTFGLFPAVNGAWLVTSEDFMKDQNVFDVFKLRAGYSITGNDDIGNYSAKGYYTSQNLLGAYGLVRGNVPNSKLKWETNKKEHVGIDMSFLKERLNVSLDAFISNTSDLLAVKNTTTTSGINVAVSNDGELQNKGIDLNITGRVIDRNNLKWDLGLNVSKYKNKLVSMSVDENLTTIAGGIVRTKVGSAISQFYGYKTAGVYSTKAEALADGLKIKNTDGSEVAFSAGDVKFVDLHKDGVIDAQDMTVIGDPNPDFTGSLNSVLQYKRFTLNTLFTFSYGNDIYNAVRANLESLSNTDNQTIAAIYRWKTDGQITNTPKATWGDPMGNSRFSDRWIEDGSYIRLKSVTLSYDLPLKSGFISNAQVYVTGNNLLTLTKYLGYDPEFSTSQNPLYAGIDNFVTPQSRSILFGVKIGL